VVEGLHQNAAIHIFADRKAEQSEHRGSNVKQSCAIDSFVLLDVRPEALPPQAAAGSPGSRA
jgi:hypothetical protein